MKCTLRAMQHISTPTIKHCSLARSGSDVCLMLEEYPGQIFQVVDMDARLTEVFNMYPDGKLFDLYYCSVQPSTGNTVKLNFHEVRSVKSCDANEISSDAKNQYGVDVAYFKKELTALLNSLDNRTPEELARYLKTLSATLGAF